MPKFEVLVRIGRTSPKHRAVKWLEVEAAHGFEAERAALDAKLPAGYAGYRILEVVNVVAA